MRRSPVASLDGRAVLSRVLLVVGLCLLLPSLIWLIGGMAGVLPTEVAGLAGQSGLRTLGSIAVAGCLLAAVGSLHH